MEKSERDKLHERIIQKVGGEIVAKKGPVGCLEMGADHVRIMVSITQMRDDILHAISDDLLKMEPEALSHSFSTDGAPISETSKSWVRGYENKINQRFGRLPIWYHVPFFQTKDLADFEHWGRAEFLSVDEVAWLSVGFEPAKKLMDKIKPFDARGNAQKVDSMAEYMTRHKETIRRKFDPYNHNDKPDLLLLHDWIEDVKLNVHPEFMAMLAKRVTSNRPSIAVPEVSIIPEQLDGREMVSMSKLIAAMAIDGYGYDPKARRSQIPMEIQGVADRLGLALSDDTIRKYLKKGSELIPEDWKPE
ncbi:MULTISPECIES: hypothetical protein [unclassified Falsihalocynthiibacter]|uniref:hypothetical protein n=1 Tax=unclassified Falsihalocynthiibacter TaxID=2854191 RepID=UPI00350F66F8